MNFATLSLADIIGTIVGLVLTLAVFSYLLGDNILFRIAIYIFVGVAAGFAAVMVLHNVIWSLIIIPLIYGSQTERLLLIVPLLLVLPLSLRAFPRFGGAGGLALAFLVGVGAAVAIGGAVLGTIFPQVTATAGLINLSQGGIGGFLQGVVILLGTVTTLIYFHFGTRARPGRAPQRAAWIEGIAQYGGQTFIIITFGVIFAGVYAAALTALIERLNTIMQLVVALIWP